MALAPTHTHQHRHIFRGFDESMTRMLGADLRLLYGLGIPILMIIGLIIVLALEPATWLVGAIVILEVAALAVIVVGLLEMMTDDDDDAQRSS